MVESPLNSSFSNYFAPTRQLLGNKKNREVWTSADICWVCKEMVHIYISWKKGIMKNDSDIFLSRLALISIMCH